MQVHIDLEGRSGLLMHNARLADPLDPLALELSKMTSKRQKTEEDHREIADLEWKASMYYEPTIGPYIPSGNLLRCFDDAGKNWKLGSRVYNYVVPLEGKIPLQYDGPRELAKLSKREEFRFRTTVKVAASRTARTRPVFRAWGLSFDLQLEDDGLSWANLLRITERAGRLIGLGDGRKIGYGRFVTTVTKS